MSGLRDCRRSQPFAVSTAGAIQIEVAGHLLGGGFRSASFIPFLPFDVCPFDEGLVACGHGQTISEGKPTCPTPSVPKSAREMTS